MKKLRTNLFTGGTLLVGAFLFANVLNFVFNAFLGRVLSFNDFGVVTLVNTIWYLISIILNALSYTVTQRVSFLSVKQGEQSSNDFTFAVLKRGGVVSIFLTLLWVIMVPFIDSYFKINSLLVLLSFTPAIIFGLIGAVNKGYLRGELFFIWLASVLIMEPIVKLLIVAVLLFLNLKSYSYLSIPLAIILSSLISMVVVFKRLLFANIRKQYAFPKRLFTASILTTLSSTAFLSFDVLLAKHFLPPTEAGEYALLSLIGKMVYFMGTLFSTFIIAYAGRDIAANINPNKRFYRFLGLSTLAAMGAFIILGPLGQIFTPLLFGSKVSVLFPYLTTYSLAILLFTISSLFVLYHLARQHFTFSVLALTMTIFMCIGILFQHNDINQITQVLLYTSLIYLILILLLHSLKRQGKFIIRNLIDLLDIFSKFPNTDPGLEGKRILIFNWRDTKHSFAGGAEVYIHELAKRWVKAGYKITLFCGNDGKCMREEIIDGVEIIRRGGFYFVYIWAFYYYLIRFRGKYDIIIDCQNGIPFFTPLYAKEKVYALMFHVHQEVFMRSLPKPLAQFAAILENRVMPYVYRKTKFVTISESTKKEMEDLSIGKAGIEIIYPGIDLENFKPSNKSKHPTVLYVGRLQFYKSVDVFIQAAKEVIKKHPNTKFMIAGDGEERNKLTRLVDSLGLNDEITFLGKVTEEAKIKLYQEAWVFVNPSYKEGWGITTIEANACGTPVVASDVPGLRDSVNNPHTGHLVEYGNSTAFAEKISDILDNSLTREYMIKNSITWANQFAWEKSAQKGLEVIR